MVNEEQHKAFGQRFGSLNVHPRYVPLEGHPEIFPIRKDPEHTKIVGGSWHQDLTHLEKPPLGSILYALDVPSVGGDTLFANQYLAYEALSEGMRKMLDKLVAVHDNRVQAPNATPERNAKMTSKLRDDPDEKDEPEMEHPVVRTHPETGRKALYVNSAHTVRFAGMTEEESKPLIDFLITHAVRPEFTCRFHWEAEPLAIWDNRCVQHFAINDYHGERRRVHRATITGDRPQ